jgi:hypothetical protein
MPAEYLILTERRLVLSRGHGLLLNEDILGHARRLKVDPLFHPDFRQFVDFGGLDPSPVTTDVIHAIRGNMNPFHPAAVRAMYAPHDMSFALCRMFEMLHADKHLLVTRSREEAERHVGLLPGESLALWQISGRARGV